MCIECQFILELFSFSIRYIMKSISIALGFFFIYSLELHPYVVCHSRCFSFFMPDVNKFSARNGGISRVTY